MRSPMVNRDGWRDRGRNRMNISPRYRRRSREDDRKRDEVDPKKIKITLPIASAGMQSSWMTDNGSGVETNLVRNGGRRFQSSEEEPPKEKALKKIQIEIRRNIKSSGRSLSPIRRSLRSFDDLCMPRRPDEGSVPLFNHIQNLDVKETKRIISLGGQKRSRRSVSRSRTRSRSPMSKRSLYSDTRRRSPADVRARLGNKSENGRQTGVHSRLGRRRHSPDNDRILDREELESQRPMVNPWDVNPEFVPRGRNYFEHDDREGDEPFRGGRGRGFRGRFNRGRGGRGGRGGGSYYQRRNAYRGGSPEWKHDKFNFDDEHGSVKIYK